MIDSLFIADSTFADIPWTVDGVMGTPLPYSIRGDNALTVLLLACGGLLAVILAKSGVSLSQHAKSFFHSSRAGSEVTQNINFMAYGFFLLIDCLLLAIMAYVYATEKMECRFSIQPQVLVMLCFFALFLVYFVMKGVVYSFVNSVFFVGKKNQQWNASTFLLIAIETILLFPLVLLLVYFDLSVEKALLGFIFVLFLNKMLAFYKGWSIFFNQKGRSLQIFLYFCALEIVPLFALGGAWLEIVNHLKVNF